MDNQKMYQQFAPVYDEFMSHVPYDKWLRFTKEILTEFERTPKNILDLGTGTGEIALMLAKEGYQVIGVDVAPDMLSRAHEKAVAVNMDITWINQDIRELSGFKNIEVCISYLDVMNYIIDISDVKKVFTNVYQALAQDGIFIFDVHHMGYVNEQLIGQTFADVTDELAYIWECVGSEREGEMYHYLTFFRKAQNQYIRFDEIHHQLTLTPSTYNSLLKTVGFSKIHFYSDFNSENNKIEKNSERIFIIAEK